VGVNARGQLPRVERPPLIRPFHWAIESTFPRAHSKGGSPRGAHTASTRHQLRGRREGAFATKRDDFSQRERLVLWIGNESREKKLQFVDARGSNGLGPRSRWTHGARVSRTHARIHGLGSRFVDSARINGLGHESRGLTTQSLDSGHESRGLTRESRELTWLSWTRGTVSWTTVSLVDATRRNRLDAGTSLGDARAVSELTRDP